MVEAVSFIGLGGMESPGYYITCEVSGNVCVCVSEREKRRDCPFNSFVSLNRICVN